MAERSLLDALRAVTEHAYTLPDEDVLQTALSQSPLLRKLFDVPSH